MRRRLTLIACTAVVALTGCTPSDYDQGDYAGSSVSAQEASRAIHDQKCALAEVRALDGSTTVPDDCR